MVGNRPLCVGQLSGHLPEQQGSGCCDLSLRAFERETRHNGKELDQREREDSDSRHQTADGLESATTVDIGNSAATHRDESQDMALSLAGR